MSDEVSLARGWTLEAYVSHNEAMRQEHDRFLAERDRRNAEVKRAEEKALSIKEKADEKALGLQAQNQAYRDEKGNDLRTQIERERGTYATRIDLTATVEKIEAQLKPVSDYVTAQQGGPKALTAGTVVSVIAAVSILLGLYLGFKSIGNATTRQTPTVICTAEYHPLPCP